MLPPLVQAPLEPGETHVVLCFSEKSIKSDQPRLHHSIPSKVLHTSRVLTIEGSGHWLEVLREVDPSGTAKTVSAAMGPMRWRGNALVLGLHQVQQACIDSRMIVIYDREYSAHEIL